MAQSLWWLVQALGTESRAQEEHLRLRQCLITIALEGGELSETDEPVLTNTMVKAVQDGRGGTGGCYRRMTRLLRGQVWSAADWLWHAVAALQLERRVSSDANRLARGTRAERGRPNHQIGWRQTLETDRGSWSRLRAKAVETVLRLQGNAQMMEVPCLRRRHRKQFRQRLQSEVHCKATQALVMKSLLWVISALDGVQVEGLREQMALSPLVVCWIPLQDAVRRWEDGLEQLVLVRQMVLGWLRAASDTPRSEQKLLVNWFAGWPEVMRQAASELGWEMVAVDNREGLGSPHHLNVLMDMLLVAPQFWRLEVARLLGVNVLRLGPNWFGILCTTTSRCDASNSMRRGFRVWYNYRKTKHRFRDPQHGVGTVQGDKARETNRLVAGVCWVTEDAGESWGIENPDGQMQLLQQLRMRREWLNKFDYCRLWSAQERAQGMLWQKMCCVWTRRKDGTAWGLGTSLKCRQQCKCRVGKGRKHAGQVEAMTAMVRATGMRREQLKCRYPKQLVLRWLRWVTLAEHRPQLV